MSRTLIAVKLDGTSVSLDHAEGMAESAKAERLGRVLIVDDSPVEMKLLEHMIRSRGHVCILAGSAEAALKEVRDLAPDIILLDIMMPEMDGFELCAALKSIPGIENVPVLFISASSDSPEKVKAFSLGAVDYITKPFWREEVLALLEVHLSNYLLKVEQSLMIMQLETALAEVSQLKGLLPICAVCKCVRDDQGYWNNIEKYIGERSEAEFSHAICPACEAVIYPDLGETRGGN